MLIVNYYSMLFKRKLDSREKVYFPHIHEKKYKMITKFQNQE